MTPAIRRRCVHPELSSHSRKKAMLLPAQTVVARLFSKVIGYVLNALAGRGGPGQQRPRRPRVPFAEPSVRPIPPDVLEPDGIAEDPLVPPVAQRSHAPPDRFVGIEQLAGFGGRIPSVAMPRSIRDFTVATSMSDRSMSGRQPKSI